MFAGKGYAGATTREIAEQVGVSEALLFRHFGSKAQLFESSIIDPFNELIMAYIEARHGGVSPVPLQLQVMEQVPGLSVLIGGRRAVALVASPMRARCQGAGRPS
jgi:AcrR family transcriptional regulator